MSKQVLTSAAPSRLKEHPLSASIYGTEVSDELVADIKSRGVITPIVCTVDYVIVSGHSRKRAAQKAGLKSVPILIDKSLHDELEIERLVITSNSTARERTMEQKAREFKELKRIAESVAAKRHGKKGAAVGRAGDIAAAEIGESRATMERAEKVIDAIDAAPKRVASQLRDVLENEGVRPALEMVKESGSRDPDCQESPGNTHVSDKNEPEETPGKVNLREWNKLLESIAKQIDDAAKRIPEYKWWFDCQSSVETVQKHLKAAASCVRVKKGHRECPRCEGGAHGCTSCKESGFMPERAWASSGGKDKEKDNGEF